MNYFIPLIVNERKYVTFCLDNKEDIKYRFLSGYSSLRPITLFRFKNKFRATCSSGTDGDEYVQLRKVEFKKEELTIEFSEYKDNSKRELDSIIVSEKGDYTSIDYSTDNCTDYKPLSITLKLINKKKISYWKKFYFYLFPEAQYYKAALDFGSESSQAIYNDCNHLVNIIDEAKKTYYDPGEPVQGKYSENNNKDFHQYDGDGDYLFRSRFYIDDHNWPLFLTLKTDDDNLKTKNYEYTNNIKISFLENRDVDQALEVYKRIILKFIETIYGTISDKRNNGKQIGVQLDLLVPNVMDFSKVNKLTNNILENVKKAKDISGYLRFDNLHLEITPISESDASFVGYCPQVPGKQERILTIDGGKGTIDYSLSQINKDTHGNWKIDGLFLGGFIGAGEAITYALLDHICSIIVGSVSKVEERKQLMRQILSTSSGQTSSDQKSLLELHEVLEDIKKSYSISNDYDQDSINARCEKLNNAAQDYQSLSASGLNTILRKQDIQGCLGDRYSILLGTCYDICSKLINSIENKIGHQPQIDKVYFAGRAFKFPLLIEMAKILIKEHWGLDDKAFPEIDNMNMKKVCLEGAIRGINLNYNCGLLNMPQIYTDKDDIVSLKNWNNTKPDIFALNEDFILSGKKIREEQHVKVNGLDLQFADGSVLENDKGERELFYTGEGFMLRYQKKTRDLCINSSSSNNNDSLLIKSKFPEYTDDEIKRLPVFEIKK